VEDLQKFSDPPLRKHNGCGGRLKRLLSAPAIQFKGAGWYVTDYGRMKGGSAGDDKRDAGTEAKAESKPGTADAAPAKKDEKSSAAKESTTKK